MHKRFSRIDKLRKSHSKISPKSKFLALFFCFAFGTFGFHRLYLGRILSGLVMFLLGFGGGVLCFTAFMLLGGILHILAYPDLLYFIYLFFGLLWIWVIVDFTVILFGGMRDGKGRYVRDW